MDVTENYPSLINCLETGQNGFFLDLSAPSGGQADAVASASCNGPFSETIPGCIKTDGDGVVQQVLLVLQRDRYDKPGSLLPLNNRVVETAWQNAFTFYRNRRPAKAPIFFKHQINPKGEFEPLQPLFCCRETGRWFHPVCPQCGLALTLCRDDALLEKRGLPSYSESLDRFLYCGACATLSDSSPFFSRVKAAGMPDHVHDASALVTQWKQLLSKFPDDTDLPCRGCPDRDMCYGPDALASGRMVPFRFFPFYMIMVPAPSFPAAAFIPLISGDRADAPPGANNGVSLPGANRFLFQDQDRQFLEILYLKLTFLAQVCRQLMPADDPAAIQEFDLSLEGLGVDLNLPGEGLPAYWNFNVRIMDAVGTFQVSPFFPSMPEAPRLHFLGAAWFRTLLVNSRQPADTVYAEVGRLLRQMDKEKGVETLEIDSSTPLGVFAGNQIFWVPDQRILADNWQGYWKQTLRMGFELVDAGLRTGVAWDHGQFLSTLDALRNQIRDEMFSGPAIASTGKEKAAAPDQIKMVLHGILQKWQAETPDGSQPILGKEPDPPDVDETIIMSSATERPASSSDSGLPTAEDLQPLDESGLPPGGSDWNSDIQETVIFSSADSAPPLESTLPDVAQPPQQESQWSDDMEKTVALRTDSTAPSPEAVAPVDDMDRTVIISAASRPPDASPPGQAEDLAATMIQNGPGPPPLPSGGFVGDLEETVVINAGVPPDPKKEAPPGDDDLAATIIQGASDRQPIPSPEHGINGQHAAADPPASDRSATGDDLDATVIISPAGHHPSMNHSTEMPSGPVDEDLAATLVETPRSDKYPHTEQPLAKGAPSTPPIPLQKPYGASKPGPGDDSQPVAPDPASGEDDISEQTIIIRSDVKKE